jgi:hypothetical protein
MRKRARNGCWQGVFDAHNVLIGFVERRDGLWYAVVGRCEVQHFARREDAIAFLTKLAAGASGVRRDRR